MFQSQNNQSWWAPAWFSDFFGRSEGDTDTSTDSNNEAGNNEAGNVAAGGVGAINEPNPEEVAAIEVSI